MQKQKIYWVIDPADAVGNGFGYSHHNRMMKKFCEKYFDYDPEAKIALHIIPADKFIPIPGKFNILFTMWEALDVPESYKKNIPLADMVIVPCRFCKDIFSPLTKKPIEVCWEGVDGRDFPFHDRKKPNFAKGEKFRYLWVGAPNPRKGYELMIEVTKIAVQTPNIEIYLKTTVPQINYLETIKNTWRHRKHIFSKENRKLGLKAFWSMLCRIPRPQLANKVRRLGKHKNIIFDTRKLSKEDLLALYKTANVFCLPSWGEGWGLTLCEAMATGAPCVATENTGTADFFDEDVGFKIDHKIEVVDFTNYDLKGRVYLPDMSSFLKKMVEAFQNYDDSLKRGRKASKRIHSKFTWENSASRLNEIIEKAVKDVGISS